MWRASSPVDAEYRCIAEWVTQTYELYGNVILITEVTGAYINYFQVDYMSGVNPKIPVGEQHLSHQTRYDQGSLHFSDTS